MLWRGWKIRIAKQFVTWGSSFYRESLFALDGRAHTLIYRHRQVDHSQHLLTATDLYNLWQINACNYQHVPINQWEWEVKSEPEIFHAEVCRLYGTTTRLPPQESDGRRPEVVVQDQIVYILYILQFAFYVYLIRISWAKELHIKYRFLSERI